MDRKFKRGLMIAFLFVVGVLSTTTLQAQENPELMVGIMNRIDAIEAENRELRGQIEESRHEVAQLKQRMETLNADIDYRLNNPDSGGGAPGLPAAVPTGEVLSGDADKKAIFTSSTATEAYEKARALLEQGDYEAAEHAFAAFVTTFPKDENTGAAQYWLGVTYFVRGQHEKAVASFAKGYKTYPKCSKAADNLLKLAKSLAALDRKADACTTLEQLATEHPKSHVKEVASEKKKCECK